MIGHVGAGFNLDEFGCQLPNVILLVVMTKQITAQGEVPSEAHYLPRDYRERSIERAKGVG